MRRPLMVEYVCGGCGHQFDSLESADAIPEHLPCPKGCVLLGYPRGAERVVSATHFKAVYAWVTQGGVEEPPPGSGFMDTRRYAKEYA